ncbi:MAG: hypothetical protein JF595_15970 [Sphingomonadales bacterium]|nr:hypothetical protein [Sphingomonadales bacterium]
MAEEAGRQETINAVRNLANRSTAGRIHFSVHRKTVACRFMRIAVQAKYWFKKTIGTGVCLQA